MPIGDRYPECKGLFVSRHPEAIPTVTVGGLTRDRRLIEIDWQRMGYTSPQLLNKGASIIASVDRLLGRSWDRKRLARWEARPNDSLFRSTGPLRGNEPLATRDVTSPRKVWASDTFPARKSVTRRHFRYQS